MSSALFNGSGDRPAPRVSCWADRPADERIAPDGYPETVHTTCLLPEGHAGPHEWVDEDSIEVEFVGLGEKQP